VDIHWTNQMHLSLHKDHLNRFSLLWSFTIELQERSQWGSPTQYSFISWLMHLQTVLFKRFNLNTDYMSLHTDFSWTGHGINTTVTQTHSNLTHSPECYLPSAPVHNQESDPSYKHISHSPCLVTLTDLGYSVILHIDFYRNNRKRLTFKLRNVEMHRMKYTRLFVFFIWML